MESPMHKIKYLIIMIILCFNLKLSATDDKLPEGFYSINNINDGRNFIDLKPIGELIDNSKLVAIGESHHTSKGFYQAKFRIIQYLIKELNFRAIAFEDNWDAVLEINNFLLNGIGNSKSALLKFYPVWRAETILEMLNWMREFNKQNPSNPVKIFGFDMQNIDKSSQYLLNAFKSNQKNDFTDEVLECNKSLPYYYNKNIKMSECNKCLLLSSKLIKNSNFYSKNFPYSKVAAISLKSNYERSCTASEQERLAIRDQAMAKILPLMLERIAPNSKSIIWAANGHIHTEPLSKSMGKSLKKIFTSDYKTILVVASTYDTHKDPLFDFIRSERKTLLFRAEIQAS